MRGIEFRHMLVERYLLPLVHLSCFLQKSSDCCYEVPRFTRIITSSLFPCTRSSTLWNVEPDDLVPFMTCEH
jgi:hypothetical protein